MNTVIWDFNGTILDDVKYSYDIEQKMLEKRNMPTFSFETYRKTFSFPVQQYYRRIGYTFENETMDDVSLEYHVAYDKDFLTCPLMDGFLDLIKKSVAKGNRNIILSATRQDKLIQQCQLLDIDKYFEALIGIDNLHGTSKIEIGKQWLSAHQIQGEDCLYIGDSVHDLECGIALGCREVVLVSQGHQAKEVLMQHTENVVDSLREVEV